MHAIDVLLKRCFVLGPCKGVIKRTIDERAVQLEESHRSEKTSARKQSDWPLLEDVTRHLLVKTLRDGKDSVILYKVWK
jgi:hypothetical protein